MKMWLVGTCSRVWRVAHVKRELEKLIFLHIPMYTVCLSFARPDRGRQLGTACCGEHVLEPYILG